MASQTKKLWAQCALEEGGGGFFHSYSTFARGSEIVLNTYKYLELVPKDRYEDGLCFPMAWVRISIGTKTVGWLTQRNRAAETASKTEGSCCCSARALDCHFFCHVLDKSDLRKHFATLRKRMEGVKMSLKNGIVVAAILLVTSNAFAQDGKGKYPSMAPLEQYLIADRDAEISLARSAAPKSISENAEVLILSRHGYETAVKGTNGFVCVVERSWSAGVDDPDFWNPKLRAPICFNAPGARSQVPGIMKRTELVLAGRSKTEVFTALGAAIETKELPTPEPGAMCYMLSKQGYLNDRDGHWHPHLMFFVAETDPKDWGAGFSGSPMMALEDAAERLTVFLVPVGRWSDGTSAPADEH